MKNRNEDSLSTEKETRNNSDNLNSTKILR